MLALPSYLKPGFCKSPGCSLVIDTWKTGHLDDSRVYYIHVAQFDRESIILPFLDQARL